MVLVRDKRGWFLHGREKGYKKKDLDTEKNNRKHGKVWVGTQDTVFVRKQRWKGGNRGRKRAKGTGNKKERGQLDSGWNHSDKRPVRGEKLAVVAGTALS